MDSEDYSRYQQKKRIDRLERKIDKTLLAVQEEINRVSKWAEDRFREGNGQHNKNT